MDVPPNSLILFLFYFNFFREEEEEGEGEGGGGGENPAFRNTPKRFYANEECLIWSH